MPYLFILLRHSIPVDLESSDCASRVCGAPFASTNVPISIFIYQQFIEVRQMERQRYLAVFLSPGCIGFSVAGTFVFFFTVVACPLSDVPVTHNSAPTVFSEGLGKGSVVAPREGDGVPVGGKLSSCVGPVGGIGVFSVVPSTPVGGRPSELLSATSSSIIKLAL